MDYYQYTFKTEAATAEILIALLGQYPFDTFQETTEGLEAYIPCTAFDEEVGQYIEMIAKQFNTQATKKLVEGQNWNAVWESNFQPIIVEDFCAVRADLHEAVKGVKYELIIQPKMSFGTGHHATTYLMMQQMRDLDFAGRRVFDYGCGTGVLAILASKLDAQSVDAIDIDQWAYENTVENIATNQVSNVHAKQGTLDTFSLKTYDIILANITFNVIVNSLEELASTLPTGGWLLTSGYFVEDVDKLCLLAATFGFTAQKQLRKEDWMCILFQNK
ncbi:MAG: 50S ribosomal protein L11 methyltransferase [Bacteroidota bacterium]